MTPDVGRLEAGEPGSSPARQRAIDRLAGRECTSVTRRASLRQRIGEALESRQLVPDASGASRCRSRAEEVDDEPREVVRALEADHVPDRGNHDLARAGYLVLEAMRVLERLVDVEC